VREQQTGALDRRVNWRRLPGDSRRASTCTTPSGAPTSCSLSTRSPMPPAERHLRRPQPGRHLPPAPRPRGPHLLRRGARLGGARRRSITARPATGLAAVLGGVFLLRLEDRRRDSAAACCPMGSASCWRYHRSPTTDFVSALASLRSRAQDMAVIEVRPGQAAAGGGSVPLSGFARLADPAARASRDPSPLLAAGVSRSARSPELTATAGALLEIAAFRRAVREPAPGWPGDHPPRRPGSPAGRAGDRQPWGGRQRRQPSRSAKPSAWRRRPSGAASSSTAC